MIRRLIRDTVLVCLTLTLGAVLWRPDRPQLALGVVGGGVLAGLSFWAIRGAVDRVVLGARNGQFGRVSRGFPLVKFFTRHVILALAAYGMMVRLQLDPVGMVVGVTSAVVATGIEAARRR
jgi:hypothetical protein